MYLRKTERRNRDGSTVAYYALAENNWNAETRRSETRVIHTFGRADQLDTAALQRLVASINRVLEAGDGVTPRPRPAWARSRSTRPGTRYRTCHPHLPHPRRPRRPARGG